MSCFNNSPAYQWSQIYRTSSNPFISGWKQTQNIHPDSWITWCKHNGCQKQWLTLTHAWVATKAHCAKTPKQSVWLQSFLYQLWIGCCCRWNWLESDCNWHHWSTSKWSERFVLIILTVIGGSAVTGWSLPLSLWDTWIFF